MGDFRDVEQAAFAAEVHESAIRHYRLHDSAIDVALFRGECDAADAGQRGVNGRLVGAGDVDHALVAHFRDVDDRTGLGLDFLDDLAARADDGADIAFVNEDFDDARGVRLVVFAGRGHRFGHFFEDVQATAAGLVECFSHQFVGEAVYLDIHLAAGDSFARTGHFEVHIAECVLVAEDIAQDSRALPVADQAHGDSGDGGFDLDAAVHQGQRARTDRCHG